MKLVTFIFTLCSCEVFAKEKFRYFSEWKALYHFNGSNRITKLQQGSKFKIPGSDCFIGAESNPRENQFQRSIICPKKEVFVDCVGRPRTWEKEMIVRCEKRIGKGEQEVVLIGKVKTFYTRNHLRKLQLEKELKNETPY